MSHTPIKEQARQRFTEYLSAHGQRKTAERFAVLDAVYSTPGHFDIEELLRTMLDNNRFHISRATLYNTIDLLVDARLVVKHQFGDHTAHYERALQTTPHHHLVCTRCGKVTELASPALEKSLAKIATPGFKSEGYALYIYGTCADCAAAEKKKKEPSNNQ